MPVLNWRADSLLFDTDCTPMNTWVTANKLIESEFQEKIFLSREKLLLNLFPILVRKVDFVRTGANDRILARFPFKVLTEEEHELINDKDLLIAEVARNYFYRSITLDVLDWRTSIKHYLERGAMPYPLVRCAWQVIPRNEPEEAFLAFENAKGKRYQVPQQLSVRLAYLCGVCNGDGHLNEHWMRIVDETREHIENLSRLFQELFQDAGRVFFFGNAWNVELSVSSAIRLINFLTDQSINMPKYAALREPLLFQQFGNAFRSSYWRGAMDADGSFTNQISFTSSSKNFVENFREYLQSKGIDSKFFKIKLDAYMLIVPAKETTTYAKLIGVSNPKKQLDLYRLLQRKRYSNQYKGLKKGVLTSDGYFNFLLLKGIQVIGLDTLLNEFRAGRTYNEVSSLFILSQGSYSNYEKKERSVPLTLINKIVKEKYQQSKTIMKVLEENFSNLLFKSTTSEAIKLPLKPSNELEELLPFLDPRENYLNICMDSTKIHTLFYDQFNVLLKDHRLNNRLIAQFLNAFFDYDLRNSIVAKEEFIGMKKEWEETLQKSPLLL